MVLVKLTTEEINEADRRTEKSRTRVYEDPLDRNLTRAEEAFMKSFEESIRLSSSNEDIISLCLVEKDDIFYYPVGNITQETRFIKIKFIEDSRGKLVLYDEDPDSYIYVLVSSDLYSEFNIIGWCYGYEGKISEYRMKNVGYGKPCFFVSKKTLRSLEALKVELERYNQKN
jgi:hypothetical protein